LISPPLNHIYLWSGWLGKLNALWLRHCGVIPHPLPEMIFLMVEIPTPKPYIFMIRVNRQIKCPKSCDPGSSPSPTRIFFENYTYLWNYFVNFNQTLPKCSLGGPLPKLFFSFLHIYKTRSNDFDLQHGCCISDAFSIFLVLFTLWLNFVQMKFLFSFKWKYIYNCM
jgi:hypothetical protein